jgi:hypothetical protein
VSDLVGSSGRRRETGRCVIRETERGRVTSEGLYTNQGKRGVTKKGLKCFGHTLQRTDITARIRVNLTAYPRNVLTAVTQHRLCHLTAVAQVTLRISVLVWPKVFPNPLKHEKRGEEIGWGIQS